MKNFFTLVLLLAINIVHAQYFQQRFNLDYATPRYRNERFNSGIVTRDNLNAGNPAFYYFAGIGTSYNNKALQAPDNLADRMRFTLLDNNGAAVVANLGYQFADASTAPVFNSYGNSIAEVKNANFTGGYVTVGEVKNDTITHSASIAGGSDVLFTQLNSSGGVVSAVRYDITGGSDRAWCIRKSIITINGQPTWIVCGESQQNKKNTVCFVARVFVNGNIVWFNTYSFDPSGGNFNTSINTAKQLCEDTQGNIYVVGTVQDVPMAAPGIDGLAFKLTQAGAVVWANSYNANTDDEFQAVRLTIDGNIVIGGFTNFAAVAPVTSHMLITKLNSANGAIIFQNILRAAKGNNVYTSKCYDIIETKGPQYFLAGPVTIGNNNFQMMYKANAGGLGINWYQYNKVKYLIGFGLDDSNTGALTGVAYFSSLQNPDTARFSDSHIMKTNYVGKTCNFCGAIKPSNIQLNLEVHQSPHLVIAGAQLKQLFAQVFKYDNKLICNTDAITCKDAIINDNDDEHAEAKTATVKLSPNPVNSLLHLQFSNIEAGKYNIIVVNKNGNTVLEKANVYCDNFSSIDLNVSALQQGIYLVRISNGTKVLEQKLLKE